MIEIARQTQSWLGVRLAGHDGVRKSRRHVGEAKSSVETVGGFGEVATRVLGLSDRVVGAADGAFDVGEHDIDPAGTGDFGRGATACGFEHGVGMAGVGNSSEASEPVGVGLGIGGQSALDPVGQGDVKVRTGSMTAQAG